MAEYYHTNILLTNGNLIQEPVGEELNFHSSALRETCRLFDGLSVAVEVEVVSRTRECLEFELEVRVRERRSCSLKW